MEKYCNLEFEIGARKNVFIKKMERKKKKVGWTIQTHSNDIHVEHFTYLSYI